MTQVNAAENGIITRALPGDALALCPPLIIKEGEIDEMFDRIGRTLDNILDDRNRQGVTIGQPRRQSGGLRDKPRHILKNAAR
jgi:hypothetical protein